MRANMRIVAFIVIATVALGPSSAIAQPAPPNQPAGQARLISGLPVESVTVVATKPSEKTIKNFVETRAAPTRVLNKMARWRAKICPKTIGLGDIYAKYVSQRMGDIATAVGAPVNSDPACRPTIEVVFTTTPQDLLDNIHKTAPLYLGYHDNESQAARLATVIRPIQSWYTTESQDLDGTTLVDSAMSGGITITVSPRAPKLVLPYATMAHVSGSRINNGLSSGFYNVLIVAEPAKLTDYEVGSLADYITMLALSQPASLDSCLELPSISNMLAPGCASVSNRITDGDLAYLRALYKMPEGNSLTVQRDEIMYRMKETLVTDKGSPN
jgi:hypothetical protein